MLLVSVRHDLLDLLQLTTRKVLSSIETYTLWDTWHALVESEVLERVHGLREGVKEYMRVVLGTYVAEGSHHLEEGKYTGPFMFF